MSKEKFYEIINAPVSELNKWKIGLLVRATLPEILECELISPTEANKLTSAEYSKMVFDMNFPILREKNPKLSVIENRTVGEYTRYYVDTVRFHNTEYFISSEWYDRNQEYYIKWLKSKVKRD